MKNEGWRQRAATGPALKTAHLKKLVVFQQSLSSTLELSKKMWLQARMTVSNQ